MSNQTAINLIYVDVLKQTNGCDCGLFALAFVTTLCAGEDPQFLHFDQFTMSSHEVCLEEEDMKPFSCKRMNIKPPHNRNKEYVYSADPVHRREEE